MAPPTPVPHPAAALLDWVAADACTLPTADRPLRVAAFDDLFATALRGIERPGSPGRARLLLAGGGDLAGRVQRLADAETACCSFFTITLTPLTTQGAGDDGTVLALDIEVPLARTDVLDALVGRAERLRRTAA